MDPEMEHRLLAYDTLAPITSPPEAALAAGQEITAGSFSHADQPGVDWLKLTTPLMLEPGRHYLLECNFQKPGRAIGVLQLKGRTFFREYLLPEYGGSLAFGAGGNHATWLSLWTTAPEIEKVTVRFIPEVKAGKLDELIPFAHVRMFAYDSAVLPVQVEGWIPYQALVRSSVSAWLETPRMYQTHYDALVNGAPAEIRKSPDGLLCVRVPSGSSHVVVAYHPPRGLVALFWLSLTSIAGVALAAVFLICRQFWHEFEAGPPVHRCPVGRAVLD
jgi:hypothetical protein